MLASKTWRRRWRRRVGSMLLGMLLLFVVAELTVRALEREVRADGPPWAVHDEMLGYRNNPRFGDHNSLGLRDDPLAPKGERRRIVMLGDSVGWYGDSIADTWVGRLDERLGDHIDVVNASVKGYTLHQEIAWLERDGLALEPDILGVGFVLNDLHDFLHRFEVVDGEIVSDTAVFTEEAIEQVDSPLYRFLRKSRFLVWLRRRFARVGPDVVLGGSSFSFDARPDFKTAWVEERWERVEKHLRIVRTLAVSQDFEPFVVLFPFGDQYRADYLERDRERVLMPQRKMREICDRSEIPLIDLYDSLDRDRHLEADGIHLTPEGRKRVALLVSEFLSARELVDAR